MITKKHEKNSNCVVLAKYGRCFYDLTEPFPAHQTPTPSTHKGTISTAWSTSPTHVGGSGSPDRIDHSKNGVHEENMEIVKAHFLPRQHIPRPASRGAWVITQLTFRAF